MKQTPLKRYTPLISTTPFRFARPKTIKRNAKWRIIVMNRAVLLSEMFGFIICEYSGEPISTLSSSGEDLDDGWGHHIDRNRNNCTPENCYIVKYKYHAIINQKHLKVSQLGFEGKE